MKAIVVTLIALINPPSDRVPTSVVSVHGSWSAVNKPLEFVGWQEIILPVRTSSIVDALPERKFPLRLGGLRRRKLRRLAVRSTTRNFRSPLFPATLSMWFSLSGIAEEGGMACSVADSSEEGIFE